MELLQKQQTFFQTGKTKDIAFRKRQLRRLYRAITEREAEIRRALYLDLSKSGQEAYLTEIGLVLSEISTALRQLDRWAKPERVGSSLATWGSVSRIYREPYGSVLILAPFNYPFQLALTPLVSALAAGNCVVLKPSELTPHTESVLRSLLSECFPASYCACVCGGPETAQTLTRERFDYIFFTGSPAVGRKVYQAAAANLVPVTLELGGKSPCIVEKSANLDLAAKRIVWGKFLNAGQTCVAPDYLLAEEEIGEALIAKMRHYCKVFYTERPLEWDGYPGIVGPAQFERLQKLMEAGGRVRIGGSFSRAKRKMEPTVVEVGEDGGALMEEEIFGPVLPVRFFREKQEIFAEIARHEKPLALYLFTEDRALEEEVLKKVSFGGGCINDTVLHLCNEKLPFGGVGGSGIGSYHGYFGFRTFSHEKSVLHADSRLDMPLRYPPYKEVRPVIRKLLK